ncbi:MAG: nucleotidyltransferase family protein [Omnitrophica bacterium]|nr:nucleotidyltransferase family protein [Candidatus Omnitrophota bacterium]
MTTIILAAGYGTRLYPLTLNKPKALLEVGGKTILDRLLEKIEAVDESGEAVIVTNEKFHKSFQVWQSRHRSDIGIKVINDKTKSNETRLGAIGDINLVLEETGTKEDLLITGSDNLFGKDLDGFVRFSVAKRPFSTLALFDIKNKELAVKYGICDLNADSQVVGFEEKPLEPKTTLAASALYFIPKEKISKIREYMKTDLPKDAPGNLMKWLSTEDKVFGYVLKGAWYDIGDTESLRKADEEFSKKGEA